MSVSHLELDRLLQEVSTAAAEEWDEYAERILEAAERQFYEFGLRRTSIDRVAEAAGVSRITLYRRFANRDALLAAVVLRSFRRFIAEFDAEVSSIVDPQERFVRGVVVAGFQLSQNSLLGRLLWTDPADTLPLLTTGGGPLLAMARSYVAAQLEQARAAGMPLMGDTQMMAELLVRVAHSLALNGDTSFSGDDERLAYFARQNLLPMLCGTPAH